MTFVQRKSPTTKSGVVYKCEKCGSHFHKNYDYHDCGES